MRKLLLKLLKGVPEEDYFYILSKYKADSESYWGGNKK